LHRVQKWRAAPTAATAAGDPSPPAGPSPAG